MGLWYLKENMCKDVLVIDMVVCLDVLRRVRSYADGIFI